MKLKLLVKDININTIKIMKYQICKRCIMDTSDPEITFDENGYCNHCTTAIMVEKMRVPEDKEKALNRLVAILKENGKNKKYDCVIGVSGGVDSTYVAYIVKKLGLRPLAVHLDNGWDAELAVSNIQKVLNNLDIELYTHVLDWEEFKGLQVAFLKASTPDSEIPTDHAIFAVLREMAAKEGVPIIAGTNHSSESILPKSWSQGYSDWAYIKKVFKLYGKGRLKTFPHTSLTKKFYYDRIKRQKTYSILDFIDYDKEKAKQFLINELGWRDYGGKHHESIYTHFFQAYILPTKFGFDKRRAHLSSLIVAGQISREEALKQMQQPLYPGNKLREHLIYVPKKLGLTTQEFEAIMKTPPSFYDDISPRLQRKIARIEKEFFKKFFKIKNKILPKKKLINV